MFEPWIGNRYNSRNNLLAGIKLLVLGESHYGQIQTTSAVVEKLAIAENHRFFTGLTQVISGKKKWEMSQCEVVELWQSISFYNYVPVYAADQARIRPTSEMFKLGAKPFEAVLHDLKPNAILVCGFELWRWLLKNHVADFKDGPANIPFTKVGAGWAARMKHPSSGFSSGCWHPTVVELLRLAGQDNPI